MKRLSDAEVSAMLCRPHLTERERAVAKQFYVDKIRANVISHRLGLSVSAVTSVLTLIRRKATQTPKRSPTPLLDDAWFKRQVDRVRQLAVDEERQARYLNGIERAWGEAMRKRVETAA